MKKKKNTQTQITYAATDARRLRGRPIRGPDRLHFMVCRTIGGNKTRNNDAAAATLTLP